MAALAVLVALTGSACQGGSADDKARDAIQSDKADGPTLEKTNLGEKRKREDNPDAVGYVYLMNFGQVVGYYVSRGKISSSGSQATPEQKIHWTCGGDNGHYGCQPVVVDGPQDDGSYGGHDPGIFFFLADGTKIVTSLDYIHTDRPIPGVTAPTAGWHSAVRHRAGRRIDPDPARHPDCPSRETWCLCTASLVVISWQRGDPRTGLPTAPVWVPGDGR